MTETWGDGHSVARTDGEDTSEAVLRAVAAASDRSMLALPPLYDAVDVDALDRLFASPTDVDSFSFVYGGYEVTVDPDHVTVRETR